MAVPLRSGQAGTFFITAVCADRRRIFQVEAAAQMMWDHLQQNRRRSYLLHAFVIMPEHLHLLLTPLQTLEYAMQIVKGGYSHKLRRDSNRSGEVWQRGFTDHRIRDRQDFIVRKTYLENNPVVRGLCSKPEEYRWSSAYKLTSAAEAAEQSSQYRHS